MGSGSPSGVGERHRRLRRRLRGGGRGGWSWERALGAHCGVNGVTREHPEGTALWGDMGGKRGGHHPLTRGRGAPPLVAGGAGPQAVVCGAAAPCEGHLNALPIQIHHCVHLWGGGEGMGGWTSHRRPHILTAPHPIMPYRPPCPHLTLHPPYIPPLPPVSPISPHCPPGPHLPYTPPFPPLSPRCPRTRRQPRAGHPLVGPIDEVTQVAPCRPHHPDAGPRAQRVQVTAVVVTHGVPILHDGRAAAGTVGRHRDTGGGGGDWIWVLNEGIETVQSAGLGGTKGAPSPIVKSPPMPAACWDVTRRDS